MPLLSYEQVVALLDDAENAVRPGSGRYEGVADVRIAEALDDQALEGMIDDQWGSVDEGGWFGLAGRFVLSVDSQGFFDYEVLDTEEEAKTLFLGH